MQQEEDNHRSELVSYDLSPEKLQKTLQDAGTSKGDVSSQELKRRFHYTPRNSPDKYSKTPQSNRSFRKDTKSQLEHNKRKTPSIRNENQEKIQKACPSGRFINTMIGQWSKHMGLQTPLSQAGGVQENPVTEDMKRMYVMEERKIQKLQKKLQAAEETISSLSTSHEAEMRAKEEILQQLNSDWESITKYYCEISESLKSFQQHKDNLTTLYNDVIATQQSAIKKLQQELSTMKLKDEEHNSIVKIIENQVVNQEKRIQEMILAEVELKKQFEDTKSKLILEKSHLHNVHAEEKLELMKKQENLTSMNQELQVQLEKIAEEKQNLTNIFAGKDDEVIQLREEIVTCKNKIEDLLCQNTELSVKYEQSIDKGKELSQELQSKEQEIDRLRENLNTRQEIESSLINDLNMIDNKFKNTQNDFTTMKNKLKEAQVRNSNLEKSLEEIKHKNEQKMRELNVKIEHLEKEKGRILFEKHSKIQELENVCKSLNEKHEVEVTSLKKEFNAKLAEMKETIAVQNAASVRLNETLNKMNKENQNRQANHHQKNQKETGQSIVKSDLTEAFRGTGNQTQQTQVHEMKSQDQEDIYRTKAIFIDNEQMSDSEEDIYKFSTTEITDKIQNMPSQRSPTKQNKKPRFDLNSPIKISDHFSRDKDVTRLNTQVEEKQERKNEDKNNVTTKKQIFKTRNTGLRQYTTLKKHLYGTPTKISKK